MLQESCELKDLQAGLPASMNQHDSFWFPTNNSFMAVVNRKVTGEWQTLDREIHHADILFENYNPSISLACGPDMPITSRCTFCSAKACGLQHRTRMELSLMNEYCYLSMLESHLELLTPHGDFIMVPACQYCSLLHEGACTQCNIDP